MEAILVKEIGTNCGQVCECEPNSSAFSFVFPSVLSNSCKLVFVLHYYILFKYCIWWETESIDLDGMGSREEMEEREKRETIITIQYVRQENSFSMGEKWFLNSNTFIYPSSFVFWHTSWCCYPSLLPSPTDSRISLWILF